MLMNLTRLREFEWEEQIIPIYKEYKMKITWGDQDLINILFYYHPDKLFVLPCEYNFRPDHCMYMSICPAPSGIKVIHGKANESEDPHRRQHGDARSVYKVKQYSLAGNRGYFHSDKQPIFKYISKAIEDWQLALDPYRHFLSPLIQSLRELPVVNSNCAKVTDKFLYKARQLFKDNFYEDEE